MTRFISTALVSLALLGSVAAAPASAAKTPIVGTVTVDGLGSFSALSFSFGVQSTVTGTASSTGPVGSSPQFTGLSFTKALDQNSPLLLMAAASGKRYASVRLDITGQGRSGVSASITLTNVVVTSIAALAASDDDGVPREDVTVTFQKIQMQTTGPNGTTNSAWDISKNSPV